jgi:hypothetical protein
MTIYIAIATFFYIGAYTKSAKYFYWTGILLLVSFSAFRDVSLGGFDALNYDRIFSATSDADHITAVDLDSDYSYGYILLNSIVKLFSKEYYIFQCVYNLITITLLVLVIRLLELPYKYKCLLIFSYFCFRYLWYDWVLLRQNLANLFFWLNLLLFYKFKSVNRIKGLAKYKSVLFLALALIIPPLFHTSGYLNILLLPTMLLLEKVPFRIKLYAVPIVSFLIFIVSSFIVSYFLPYMQILGDRYDTYSASSARNGNVVNYVLRLFFYFILVANIPKEVYKYKSFLLDGMIMVVLIGSVNFSSANRLYEYYAVAMYLSFTFSLRYIKKPLYKLVYYLLMIVILVRFLTFSVEGTFLNYSTWIL